MTGLQRSRTAPSRPASGPRERAKRRTPASWLSICPLLVALASCTSEGGSLAQVQPKSASCAECHEAEYEAWSGSHHDLAMQEASSATVLGDFDAEPLVWKRAGQSHQASFRHAGDDFFLRIEGPEGTAQEYRVAYTFGVTPLQQYLVEFPGGILQCLPVAWDGREERWFHLDPTPPPGDAFHWTGRYQRWNMMCAECHSTELKKGYDSERDRYTTTSVELDVGCRACHGAAGEHVRRARGWRTGQAPKDSEARGFPSGLASHAPSLELETCAPCHSRRTALTEDWRAGESFLDHFDPALLREGLYFPDGQIQDEVYVWGSFTQSRMAAAGVVCSDCHDPHGLQLKLPEGPGHNELCVQCHSLSASLERFPTLLAADYDTPDHHHHEPGSEAARCTACHMPTRTYMGVDARRDHRMGLPRPDLSVELGVPNACATCHDALDDDEGGKHLTRGHAALQAAIVAWREAAPSPSVRAERRTLEAQRARTFEHARHPDTAGPVERIRDELVAIVRDADVSALERATALELWSDLGGAAPAVLVPQLTAESALIRAVAARSLLRVQPTESLAALLETARQDPIRIVRVAAAATEETAERTRVNRDFPATWFQLGIEAQRAGDMPAAEAAWRRTLVMDPGFTPALHNLAVQLSGTGRGAEARDLLANALVAHPKDGELWYSLGLQQAELGEAEAAAVSLSNAASLLPERPRLAYNLGLLLESLKRPAEAEVHLRRAVQLQAAHAGSDQAVESSFALAGLLLRAGRPMEAREIAADLVRAHPEAGAALLAELEVASAELR